MHFLIFLIIIKSVFKYTFEPGSLVYIMYISDSAPLSHCNSFFERSIRNSFQFAFSSEAKSGSPIFSALLLKDFEQGGFLLCFISNSWSSSHSETGKRMKGMLSFFMGIRCAGDLTRLLNDSHRQLRNMSIQKV